MTYSVLLLGATGYLGGDILTTLEQNGTYDITCVVRPGKEGSLKGRNAGILVVRPTVFPKRSDFHGNMIKCCFSWLAPQSNHATNNSRPGFSRGFGQG